MTTKVEKGRYLIQAMKVICQVCGELIREIDDGEDTVSHGMHIACGLKYYSDLEDLLPLFQEV